MNLVNVLRNFGFNVKLVKSLLKDIQALERHKHYYILMRNDVKVSEFNVSISKLKCRVEELCN